eukprot:354243-Chlamydomonas_euryale.AAC.2
MEARSHRSGLPAGHAIQRSFLCAAGSTCADRCVELQHRPARAVPTHDDARGHVSCNTDLHVLFQHMMRHEVT